MTSSTQFWGGQKYGGVANTPASKMKPKTNTANTGCKRIQRCRRIFAATGTTLPPVVSA